MMPTDELQVLELNAWDSDGTTRPPDHAHQPVSPIILRAETERLSPLFADLLNREDLHQEFAGLSWRIAVVDLRLLQAFQRRLVFDSTRPTLLVPGAEDWSALTALAFGPPRPTTHNYLDPLTIQSANPDLHFRPTETGWKLHGGSPFLEVALYNERAFLRDGYHRAHALLTAGVYAIPAVVIEARSMAEVYFESPNFFPESILFGPRPPMVTDFLNPSLTSTSRTQRVFKTIQLPPYMNLTVNEHAKEQHP